MTIPAVPFDLEAALKFTCWTPRTEFGPAVILDSSVKTQPGFRAFSCGHGRCLLTNSRRGEGDPVFAIAWAISDYWIARIWNGHHMDLETRSVPEKGEPPSLEFMGRPSDLGYESILDCESLVVLNELAERW